MELSTLLYVSGIREGLKKAHLSDHYKVIFIERETKTRDSGYAERQRHGSLGTPSELTGLVRRTATLGSVGPCSSFGSLCYPF